MTKHRIIICTAWKEVSEHLHGEINCGNKVMMHCMGGSGRTGLLAAHFLLEKDWPLEKIISEIQARRPGAFTKQPQVDYIRAFAS